MAKTRRAYTGAAVSTTTASSIAASGTTSFTVTAYTGWPYGSDPFYVVVEPGTASEEKILVTRTGSTDTTINIASDSVRGQDGTSAVAHNTGSTVFPVFTAVDADEANELTSSWSTKGDLVSYGSSTFETLGVGSDGQFLRADSGETSGLAWETFNNTLGSGAAVRVPGTFVGGDVLQAAEMNALPSGLVAGITLTTSFTTSSTHTTLQDTGATVTVNEIAGRVYRHSARFNIYPSGGLQGIRMSLLRDGVLIAQFDNSPNVLDAGVGHTFRPVFVYTSSGSGSATWKWQMSALTSNTAVTDFGNATYVRQYWVEDVQQ